MFAASKSGSAADPTDPQFNYVTMLLHGDGTNGAQNNTFLDSSTNNFTITRNGNTTQGTFTPYGSNWSNFFDGTGDYLELASNSAFNMNTYCCLEAFVSYSTIGTSTLIVGRDSSYQLGYNFTAIGGTANKFVFTIYNGSSWQAVSSTTTPVAGVWYHVVGIKDNTTLRIYINGTQENTATFSGTAVTTSNVMGIGANQNTQNMAGYISNTRLVLGASSGVLPYTSNFTSPTTPLTAVSGTALLTCQSNRFVDNSTNNFTITKNGDTSVQRFSPFSPTTAYSTSVIGGSGYFDGSGDYLTLPVSSAFDLGTNACCVESWVYLTNNNIFGIFTSSNSTSGSTRPNFYARFDQLQLDYFGNVVIQANITVTLNCWHHVVFTRASSSGAWRIFLDGVLQAYNATGSQNLLQTGAAQEVGRTYAGTTGQGYAGDVRVVNGAVPSAYVTSSTTVGATIFTPPTAPLTAITNTSLLLNYTNAGILDNAMMNDLETVGNAQISTSVKKYGTGSLAFDGTGDYLVAPYRASNVLGSGDFTVEAFIYKNANTAYMCLAGTMDSSAPYDTKWQFFADSPNGTKIQWWSDNSVVISTSTLSTSTWYHVAVSRASGTIRLFINGTLEASATDTRNYSATNQLWVGQVPENNSGRAWNGYIDEFRISKFARYTSSFTAPTTAFADKG